MVRRSLGRSRRPYATFGNSTGDRQRLEYTKVRDGGLAMLLLHDDAKREYAYASAGAARHQARHLHPGPLRRGKKKGWTVISMKNDWKKIFAFE